MTENSGGSGAHPVPLDHVLAAAHHHHHHAVRLVILVVIIAVVVIGAVLYAWHRSRRRRQAGDGHGTAGDGPVADIAATAGRAARPGGALYRIGRFSARHRYVVIVAWLALVIVTFLGNRAFGGSYADNFTLSGTPAQQAMNLLRAHRPSEGGQGSGQLVFTVGSGTLSTHHSAIETAVANVGRLPGVLSVSDPFTKTSLAKDGRTAYATAHFTVNPQQLGRNYIASVNQAVAPATRAGVAVDYGGQLGNAAKTKSKDARSEIIGIIAALIILLLGFGSVYAAGLPVLSALAGAFGGLSVLGMLAAAYTFPTVSPTLAIMMGLGVGIDYALFLSTRYRQLVMDGADPVEAAATSLAGSGPAVLVAAATVVIALLGLYASGLVFMGTLGLAGGITVAVAALSAISAVPALLALAGRRIDRVRIRRLPVAEAPAGHSAWLRYAQRLGAHPWRYLIAGLVVLGVLAIPAFSIQLGHVDNSAAPAGSTARKAYYALQAGFGPGANGPLTVVAQLGPGVSSGERAHLRQSLYSSLVKTPGVSAVSPVKTTPDGALLYTTVVPETGPQDAATGQLMNTLQDHTLPDVLHATGSTGYVTGQVAAVLQFRNLIGSRLPWMIAAVIAAAFVLLLLAFRSPVLALKAGLLNLLSIGAAWGVVVAVFQWGWGSSLLGVTEKVPIESYVPMMIFAIVFGLSMDYEVFLLSRVRESWLRTGDNHVSVAHGLGITARVITCAALIMASVFAAFLQSTNVIVQMLALGLALSVLIDASVIRLVVVPCAMFLLGRYNWWTPRWLDALLPGHRPGSGQPGAAPRRPSPRLAGPVLAREGDRGDAGHDQ